MKSNSMKVLVIGATGKQGGHVARLLLKKGYGVNALTRKVDSRPARDLAELGADIIMGDLGDPKSVEKAVKSVDAVFLVTTPFEGGLDTEVGQGVTVANMVRAQGKYLVFTSVGSADKNTGIPFFDTKLKIEQHIRKIGCEAAIIAPVYFMENVITYGLEPLKEGLYSSPLSPNRKLAQVALDDIASFAVLAFENQKKFAGKRIDLASDDLTGIDAVEILSRVTGRHIEYQQVPMDTVRKMSDDMGKMFDWFERVGYKIDIPKLHGDYPEVGWHTYESWAEKKDWRVILSERELEEVLTL